MCFVFIVEISNLLKTGRGGAESIHSSSGRGCAQDGSGAHRIELGARLTAWGDAQGVRGVGEA